MTLKKRGDHWYGDDAADLRKELSRYSQENEYPIDAFVDVTCHCGSNLFRLFTDEEEGVALRQCGICEDEHLMGDSEAFAADADIGKHECHCDADVFEMTVGVHRYRDAEDRPTSAVRWLYIGCRCPSCGLLGCYADWKNEFEDFEQLLANM